MKTFEKQIQAEHIIGRIYLWIYWSFNYANAADRRLYIVVLCILKFKNSCAREVTIIMQIFVTYVLMYTALFTIISEAYLSAIHSSRNGMNAQLSFSIIFFV